MHHVHTTLPTCDKLEPATTSTEAAYLQRSRAGFDSPLGSPWGWTLRPCLLKDGRGQPPACLHICCTLRHPAGAGPLLAVCPQWAAPRFSESLSNFGQESCACDKRTRFMQKKSSQVINTGCAGQHQTFGKSFQHSHEA